MFAIAQRYRFRNEEFESILQDRRMHTVNIPYGKLHYVLFGGWHLSHHFPGARLDERLGSGWLVE